MPCNYVKARVHFHHANTARQFSINVHDMPVWSIWQPTLRFFCSNPFIQRTHKSLFIGSMVLHVLPYSNQKSFRQLHFAWCKHYSHEGSTCTSEYFLTTTNMLVNLWRSYCIRTFCVIKKIRKWTFDSFSRDFNHHDNAGFQVTLISHIIFDTWGNSFFIYAQLPELIDISFSTWVPKWLWLKKARDFEVRGC